MGSFLQDLKHSIRMFLQAPAFTITAVLAPVIGFAGILSLNPGNIPRVGLQGNAVSMDYRVVLFTLGLSLATGILFGLFPALQASRTDLSSTIKESTGRGGTERRTSLPGVENDGATRGVPLEGGYGLLFIIVGRPLEGASTGGGTYMIASPGYFDVFKIPLLRGRGFTDQDGIGAPPVARPA